MRLRAAYALLFGASATLACTAGALDGFSGGADPDAGGGSDAGSPETSGGGDADAGTTDTGADGGGVCPPTAVLCESFDTADPLSTWATFTSPNASTAVDTGRFLSSPKSLHTSLEGPATGSKRNAYIARTLFGNGVVTHARLSYAIYVESRPSNGEVEICSLRFSTAAGAYNDFYIAYDATSATLHEQHHEPDAGYIGGASSALGTLLTTGAWVRVSLEVMLGDPRSMAVSVNGVEIARTGLALNGPGEATVNVGITYGSEMAAAAAASFDDVAFEILP